MQLLSVPDYLIGQEILENKSQQLRILTKVNSIYCITFKIERKTTIASLTGLWVRGPFRFECDLFLVHTNLDNMSSEIINSSRVPPISPP